MATTEEEKAIRQMMADLGLERRHEISFQNTDERGRLLHTNEAAQDAGVEQAQLRYQQKLNKLSNNNAEARRISEWNNVNIDGNDITSKLSDRWGGQGHRAGSGRDHRHGDGYEDLVNRVGEERAMWMRQRSAGPQQHARRDFAARPGNAGKQPVRDTPRRRALSPRKQGTVRYVKGAIQGNVAQTSDISKTASTAPTASKAVMPPPPRPPFVPTSVPNTPAAVLDDLSTTYKKRKRNRKLRAPSVSSVSTAVSVGLTPKQVLASMGIGLDTTSNQPTATESASRNQTPEHVVLEQTSAVAPDALPHRLTPRPEVAATPVVTAATIAETVPLKAINKVVRHLKLVHQPVTSTTASSTEVIAPPVLSAALNVTVVEKVPLKAVNNMQVPQALNVNPEMEYQQVHEASASIEVPAAPVIAAESNGTVVEKVLDKAVNEVAPSTLRQTEHQQAASEPVNANDHLSTTSLRIKHVETKQGTSNDHDDLDGNEHLANGGYTTTHIIPIIKTQAKPSNGYLTFATLQQAVLDGTSYEDVRNVTNNIFGAFRLEWIRNAPTYLVVAYHRIGAMLRAEMMNTVQLPESHLRKKHFLDEFGFVPEIQHHLSAARTAIQFARIGDADVDAFYEENSHYLPFYELAKRICALSATEPITSADVSDEVLPLDISADKRSMRSRSSVQDSPQYITATADADAQKSEPHKASAFELISTMESLTRDMNKRSGLQAGEYRVDSGVVRRKSHGH